MWNPKKVPVLSEKNLCVPPAKCLVNPPQIRGNIEDLTVDHTH